MGKNAADENPDNTDAIRSPCINVCTLDPSRSFCIGCYRTISEITRWRDAPAEEKRRIKAAAKERYLAANRPSL